MGQSPQEVAHMTEEKDVQPQGQVKSRTTACTKASRKAWSKFPGRRELRRPARRLTFIKNNNSSKEINSSNENSHVKAAAQEAAIVGASSEAGKKVPQLTQQTRAPKGLAEKSTAEAAKRSARRVARKSTHWSSQGRWSSTRAAGGAATTSSRRSSRSDRSSRTAATKTTWTEGPLPERAD